MARTPPDNAAETVGVRTDMEDRYRVDASPTEPQAQRSSPEDVTENSEQGTSTSAQDVHPRWNDLSQAQRKAILKSRKFSAWRIWESVHLGDWAEESWYNSVRESRRELPEWPVVIFGPAKRMVDLTMGFVEETYEEVHPEASRVIRSRGLETEINDWFILPSAGREEIQVALQDQIYKEARAWKLGRENDRDGQPNERGDLMITKIGPNGIPTCREMLFALNMPCLLDWPSPLAPEAKAHNEYVINSIRARAQDVNEDQAWRYVLEAIVFRDRDILFADVNESAREKMLANSSNILREFAQSYSLGSASSARPVMEKLSCMATTDVPQGIQRQLARNTGTSRSTNTETDEVAVENQEEKKKRKSNLNSKRRKAQRKARQVAAEKHASSLENQAPPGAASLESGEAAQRTEQVATLAEELCDLPGKEAYGLEEDQAQGPDGTHLKDVNMALGNHSIANAAQAPVGEVDIANDAADVGQDQSPEPVVGDSEMMGIVSEASHVLEARICTPSDPANSVTQESSVEGSGIPPMKYDAEKDEDSVTPQLAGIVGQTDLVENANTKSDDHTSHHSLSADPEGNTLADKSGFPEEADVDHANPFAEVDNAIDSQAATSEQKAIIDSEAVESEDTLLRDACRTRQETKEIGTPEAVSPKPRADIAQRNSQQSNVENRIPSKLPRVVPVMPLRPPTPLKTKPVSDTPRTPHAVNVIEGETLPKIRGEVIRETQNPEPKLDITGEEDGTNAAPVIAVSHTPSGKFQPGATPSESVVSNPSPGGTSESRDAAESEEKLSFRMPTFSGGPQSSTRRASMSDIAGQATALNRGRQGSPTSTEERLVDTRSKSLSPNNRFSGSHVWFPKVSNVNYNIRCSVDDYNAITGWTATAPVFFPKESHPTLAPAAQPYPTYPVMGPIFPHYTGEAPTAIASTWVEQGWLPHMNPFAVNQQPQSQNRPAIPPGIVMHPPPPPPMPRPRIARPIERLVRMKNIGDLAQRDIPRLLRDYQRLARELGQSGAFL